MCNKAVLYVKFSGFFFCTWVGAAYAIFVCIRSIERVSMENNIVNYVFTLTEAGASFCSMGM